jgi:hypothetical protein
VNTIWQGKLASLLTKGESKSEYQNGTEGTALSPEQPCH